MLLLIGGNRNKPVAGQHRQQVPKVPADIGNFAMCWVLDHTAG